jgi:CheY-like chemotaxis protein
VEDSKADLFLIKEAIAAAQIDASLHIVHNGEQAVQFFDKASAGTAPCPDLVLLDLTFPRRTARRCFATCETTTLAGTPL